MTMLLSRIPLNPLCADALKLAADPYRIHQLLLGNLRTAHGEPSNATDPETAELLFRVDQSAEGPNLLAQSAAPFDWEAMGLHRSGGGRLLRGEPATKPFEPVFASGQRLAFRLLAQPSVAKAVPAPAAGELRPRGRRRACKGPEEQLAWLARKSRDCGFLVESVGLSAHTWSNTKAAAKADRLGGIRYDGVLVVADPSLLARAVRLGVGRGKAFGFGMLSLGPA